MQNKLVSGGQQLEKYEAEQLAAKREYQQKLKEQRKIAKKLEEDKRKQDEELLNATSQYKDI